MARSRNRESNELEAAKMAGMKAVQALSVYIVGGLSWREEHVNDAFVESVDFLDLPES